jgi:hypothetical protein
VNSKQDPATRAKATNGETRPYLNFPFPWSTIQPFMVPLSFAETGVARGKEALEALQSVSEEIADTAQDNCRVAIHGIAECSRAVMESTRDNLRLAFDFGGEVAKAKSLADVIEISGSQSRRQFNAMLAQQRELWSLAWKAAAESAKPATNGATRRARSE